MGFTFDDTDKKQVASPLSTMHELIAANPRNQERIFPYLGGEEINDDPKQKHHRYVINFEDFPMKRGPCSPSWADADDDMRKEYLQSGIVPLDYAEPVAADWPELLTIVKDRVKNRRLKDKRENYRRLWWKYAEWRPGLQAACSEKTRVLAINCGATPHMSFAFVDSQQVFANTAVVVATGSLATFACLQSTVHEIWARVMASSMKDDLRYTPTDCFETFPFPVGYETNAATEAAGREYYEFRAALMIRNKEGLTKTYNRFHNLNEQSESIQKLRDLHHAMDRAVLDAYCWTDLHPIASHELEFEEDETEDEESSRKKRKKRKYRLRWPEEIRDEVLTRLLILNEQRAAAEAKGKSTIEAKLAIKKPKAPARKRAINEQLRLGGME